MKDGFLAFLRTRFQTWRQNQTGKFRQVWGEKQRSKTHVGFSRKKFKCKHSTRCLVTFSVEILDMPLTNQFNPAFLPTRLRPARASRVQEAFRRVYHGTIVSSSHFRSIARWLKMLEAPDHIFKMSVFFFYKTESPGAFPGWENLTFSSHYWLLENDCISRSSETKRGKCLLRP